MRMPRVFGLAAQPWPGSQQAISKCRRFDIPLSPPSPSPCETGAPIATMAAQDQDGEGGYKEHRAAIEIPAVSRGEKATRISFTLIMHFQSGGWGERPQPGIGLSCMCPRGSDSRQLRQWLCGGWRRRRGIPPALPAATFPSPLLLLPLPHRKPHPVARRMGLKVVIRSHHLALSCHAAQIPSPSPMIRACGTARRRRVHRGERRGDYRDVAEGRSPIQE